MKPKKMKNKLTRIAIFPLIVGLGFFSLFSGCTSVDTAHPGLLAVDVIEQLNTLSVKPGAVPASTSLLIDAAVVQSPDVIHDYWSTFSAAGYRFFRDSVIARPLKQDDYLLFSNDSEAAAFIGDFMESKGIILSLVSESGARFYVLAIPNEGEDEGAGKALIVGIKGPQ